MGWENPPKDCNCDVFVGPQLYNQKDQNLFYTYSWPKFISKTNRVFSLSLMFFPSPPFSQRRVSAHSSRSAGFLPQLGSRKLSQPKPPGWMNFDNTSWIIFGHDLRLCHMFKVVSTKTSPDSWCVLIGNVSKPLILAWWICVSIKKQISKIFL